MKQRLLAAAALVAAGCAAIPLPAQKLEETRATMRSAEELGAMQVPKARLHLQYAKDEEAWARQLSQTGDENAPLMLERSQADAELALTLAREAQVHVATLRAADEVNALRARGGTP